MTETAKTDMQADEREAIAAIGRSRDGKLLHRYLRRVLENVPDAVVEAGALQADRGRRSLARDLMRIMASAIEETASVRNEYGPDQPIVSGGNAVNVGARPTIREFIFANDAELAADRSAADRIAADRIAADRAKPA